MIKVGDFKFTTDSAGGIDVSLDVKNVTDKKIKYVTFWLQPFNAVHDPVASEIDGESIKKIRLTGPIYVNCWNGQAYWRTIWYNGTVYKIVILKALIEFMDGTTEEVDGKDIPVLTFDQKYEDVCGKKLNSTTTSKQGCYVATCVYQSYDCPQVWILRRYRDYYLYEHWWGRAFIKLYYKISPTLVGWFGNKTWFRRPIKKLLDRKLAKLEKKGYENTRYEDKY